MFAFRLQNLAPLPSTGRLRVVDEVKGWAMLLVLIYHGGGALGLNNPLHGEVGVDVFLIVSGFMLARGAQDLSWAQFVQRRLLRIYPAYWLALGVFLFLSMHYYGVHRSSANLVLHVLGLHGFAREAYFSDINDSFWFISLIVMLYGVFLAIRRRLADLSFVLGLGCLLTTVTCWTYLQLGNNGAIGHLGVRIPSFFIGLIAGQLSRSGISELKIKPMFAIGLIALTYFGFATNIITFYALAAPALIAAFLVVRNSLKKHPDGRMLLAAFAFLGVYSYEIFLFHQPLIRDYNRLFMARYMGITAPSQIQVIASMVVGLLLTFAISIAVHKLTTRSFTSKRALTTPVVHESATS